MRVCARLVSFCARLATNFRGEFWSSEVELQLGRGSQGCQTNQANAPPQLLTPEQKQKSPFDDMTSMGTLDAPGRRKETAGQKKHNEAHHFASGGHLSYLKTVIQNRSARSA